MLQAQLRASSRSGYSLNTRMLAQVNVRTAVMLRGSAVPSSRLVATPEEQHVNPSAPPSKTSKLTSPTTESYPAGGQFSGESPVSVVQNALPTATLQVNMHLHFLPRGPSFNTGRRDNWRREKRHRLAIAAAAGPTTTTTTSKTAAYVPSMTSNRQRCLHSYLFGQLGVVISLAGHAAKVEPISVAKVDASPDRRAAEIFAQLEPMLCG